jgi:hypothetical protein
MAFVASLLAYLASIAGIVLAFTMSYAVLFHPQSTQPAAATAPIEAAQKMSTAAAAEAKTPSQSSPTMLRWRRAATGQARHGGDVAAKAHGSVRRRTLAAREREREKRGLSPDGRAPAGQWAYQQAPGGSLFGLYDRQSLDDR